MDRQLIDWLHALNDDYIIGWANRGLLRRGRKRAQTVDHSDCQLDASGCHAEIDGHQQTFSAAGFEHLACNCPASGACYHLIAFLLCLQQHPDLPARSQASSALAPWLAGDFTALEKQLGSVHVKRAKRLLLQGVSVESRLDSNNLVAEITERDVFTVRIPASTGLSASICNCATERCVHRALAVLHARQQAGLYKPSEDTVNVLTPVQQSVITQTQDWLKVLVMQGSSSVSRTLLERGQALATQTRQADLPAIAAQIIVLYTVLEDELAGLSFVDVGQFRTHIAHLWSRLRALQTLPMPQPFHQLAGEHRRQYNLIRGLRLIGVGIEYWHSQTGYQGLTLHLYAPEQQAWYRHSQVHSAAHIEVSNWQPEVGWKQGRWGDGPYFHQIIGAELRVNKGWVTQGGELSGREGSLLEIVQPTVPEDELPVSNDFSQWAQLFRQQRLDDPFTPSPKIPVLLAIDQSDPADFNTQTQIWSQQLYDREHHCLEMQVSVTDEISHRMMKKLNQFAANKRSYALILGFLSDQTHPPIIHPISIQCTDKPSWTHLTLPN